MGGPARPPVMTDGDVSLETGTKGRPRASWRLARPSTPALLFLACRGESTKTRCGPPPLGGFDFVRFPYEKSARRPWSFEHACRTAGAADKTYVLPDGAALGPGELGAATAPSSAAPTAPTWASTAAPSPAPTPEPSTPPAAPPARRSCSTSSIDPGQHRGPPVLSDSFASGTIGDVPEVHDVARHGDDEERGLLEGRLGPGVFEGDRQDQGAVRVAARGAEARSGRSATALRGRRRGWSRPRPCHSQRRGVFVPQRRRVGEVSTSEAA